MCVCMYDSECKYESVCVYVCMTGECKYESVCVYVCMTVSVNMSRFEDQVFVTFAYQKAAFVTIRQIMTDF